MRLQAVQLRGQELIRGDGDDVGETGIVIAGAGRFGTLHARTWTEAGARISGVVDVDGAAAETLAAAHSAAAHGTELKQVLEHASPDAVVIATDENSHAPLAQEALEYGSSVFIEKPFALDVPSARRIAATAAQRGLHAFAGHISRFAQPYTRLRSSIVKGAFGDVWALRLRRDFSRSWYESFGDRVHPAWESGVHDADLAIFLTASRPRKVYAVQSEAAGKAAPSVISSVIEMENGVNVTIESAWALPDRAPQSLAGVLALDGTIAAECEVIGSRGVAKQRLVSEALTEWSDSGIMSPDLTLWPEIDGEVGGALRAEVDAALAVFRGERPNTVMPHEQAVESVRLIDALVRSLEQEAPVLLD